MRCICRCHNVLRERARVHRIGGTGSEWYIGSRNDAGLPAAGCGPGWETHPGRIDYSSSIGRDRRLREHRLAGSGVPAERLEDRGNGGHHGESEAGGDPSVAPVGRPCTPKGPASWRRVGASVDSSHPATDRHRRTGRQPSARAAVVPLGTNGFSMVGQLVNDGLRCVNSSTLVVLTAKRHKARAGNTGRGAPDRPTMKKRVPTNDGDPLALHGAMARSSRAIRPQPIGIAAALAASQPSKSSNAGCRLRLLTASRAAWNVSPCIC
jgi:hypothetical protein